MTVCETSAVVTSTNYDVGSVGVTLNAFAADASMAESALPSKVGVNTVLTYTCETGYSNDADSDSPLFTRVCSAVATWTETANCVPGERRYEKVLIINSSMRDVGNCYHHQL